MSPDRLLARMPFGTTCLSTSASCAWRMSRVPCGPLTRLSTTGGGRREARLRGKTEATNLRDTHLYLQPSILQARKHRTRTSSHKHANIRHAHSLAHPLAVCHSLSLSLILAHTYTHTLGHSFTISFIQKDRLVGWRTISCHSVR